MKRDYSPSPCVVRGDKTFNVENAGARGFSLMPSGTNRGGFPVSVSCDGRPAFEVDSPEVVTQAEAFQQLVVNTAPGGGLAGDGWRVVLHGSAAEVPYSRLRTDAFGILATTSPGAKVLFDFDLQRDIVAIRDGFLDPTGPAPRFVRVDPTNPKQLIRSNADDVTGRHFGRGFDLSGYRQVMFGVEADFDALNDHYPFPQTSLSAFVGATGPLGGFPIEEIPCGSVNQFGMSRGNSAVVHLGAQTYAVRPNAASAYLPAYAHFYFKAEDLPTQNLPRNDGEFRFRFWAVGY